MTFIPAKALGAEPVISPAVRSFSGTSYQDFGRASDIKRCHTDRGEKKQNRSIQVTFKHHLTNG